MKKALLIFHFLLISSCSLVPSMPDISENLSNFSNYISPAVYVSEINQGSVLRKEKFDLIKRGMTKSQVESLIGSPSIIDIFHSNQWEYIHHSFIKKDRVLSFRITLSFNGEILEKIEAPKIEDLTNVQDYNFSKHTIKKSNADSDSKDDEEAWYKFW